MSDNKVNLQYIKELDVLYLEDDENTRGMVEFFLRDKVKNLYVGEDGKEGLELYKKIKPDLIITDIQMPNMTGIEMAKEIRESNLDIPIIVITAFNDSDSLFEAINLGINNYLTKPLDFIILIQTLGKIAKVLNLKKENDSIKNMLEQYKDIVDSSALISKSNLNGEITYVNKHFEEVSGYTNDELVGKSYEFVRHPDMSTDGFNEIWKEIRAKKKTWSGVIKHQKKNGETYYVDTTIKPILDLNDNVLEFIALRHDVTDLETTKEYFKKQSNTNANDLQEAIKITKDYEKAINESNIFVKIDTNKNITYANELFYETYEYKKEELIGNPYSILNHPEIPDRFYRKVWSILETGSIWKGKILTKSKTGKDNYSNVTIVPLKNSKEEIVEYLGIRHDITEVVQLHNELEETQRELIYRMGEIGETRSLETGNHVKRVAEYSKLLGEKYGLKTDEVSILFMASPMHDIGKVGIPDSILNKPGKHTPEEWEIMKTHSEIGYNILKSSKRPILKAAAIISHTHHEKWDGSGYPKGLKDDNIHIFGRITAIADVFDALGSDRVYKKAWSLDKILALFKEQRGIHFDPLLVDLFLNNLNEFLEIRDKYQE
jgi:PAS domain S-box-containing protein